MTMPVPNNSLGAAEAQNAYGWVSEAESRWPRADIFFRQATPSCGGS